MVVTPFSGPELERRRDAQKYQWLSTALISISRKVHSEEEYANIDEIIGILLEDLAEAMNAEQAFIAVPVQSHSGTKRVRLTAIHPPSKATNESIESESISAVFENQESQVLDPGTEVPPLIRGLEIIDARTAILVYLETTEGPRVVGVCNRRDRELSAFLAPDMLALSNLIQLVALGNRIGEHRRAELARVEKVSTELNICQDLKALNPLIVKKADELFSPKATRLMLWDEKEENFAVVEQWSLLERDQRKQRISEADMDAQIDSMGEAKILTVNLPDPVFGAPVVGEQANIDTVIVAPLWGSKEYPFGLLNLYIEQKNRSLYAFEEQLVATFANQAAISIENALLIESLRSQKLRLEAFYEASKPMAEARLDPESTLQRILELAAEATGAHTSMLQLKDDDKDFLYFHAAHPPDQLEILRDKIGVMPLDGKGITVRAMNENLAQLSQNVELNEDFIRFSDQTQSELAVVLRRSDDGPPFGVLNVEHQDIDGLNTDYRDYLIGLANLAVAALRYADQAETQRRNNVVAVMGAWGANIVNTVRDRSGAIQLAVLDLLRRDDLPYSARSVLRDIEGFARDLALPDLPETAPDVSQPLTLLDTSLVNVVINSEIEKLQTVEISISLQSELGSEVRVAIQEQWLRMVLHDLISNSIRAIKEIRSTGAVEIRACTEGGAVKIEVEDNGKGVRPEIRALLFKEAIPHTGRREHVPAGQALVLVAAVIWQVGGQIRLEWSQEKVGACFSFTLPVAPSMPSDFRQLTEEESLRHDFSRILIVENDPAYQVYLQRNLEQCVVGIAEGASLDQLKTIAKELRPHVAVVDLEILNSLDVREHPQDQELMHVLASAKCILYANDLTLDVADKARQRYEDVELVRRYLSSPLLQHIDTAIQEKHKHRGNLPTEWLAEEQWNSQQVIYALFGTDTNVRCDLVDDVLYQLFGMRTDITLQSLVGRATPLAPEKKRCVVMQVSSSDVNTVVVKLAPTEQIRRNVERYSEHIEDPKHGTKKGSQIRGDFFARLDNWVYFWDLGGAVYSLVGAGDQSNLVSFQDFFFSHNEPEHILASLNYFFETVWSIHYGRRKPSDKSLFEMYDQVLGEEDQSLEDRLRDPERAAHFQLPANHANLPNPAEWLLQHKDESRIFGAKQAIVHGDLHGENLYVDGTYAWVIDFERTGPGHALHDFIELEMDIITHIIPWEERSPLVFLKLIDLLTAPSSPVSTTPSTAKTDTVFNDREIEKAMQVIIGLRRLAYKVTEYTEFREYLWGLLIHNVFAASIRPLDQKQRERAVIFSALICTKLSSTLAR